MKVDNCNVPDFLIIGAAKSGTTSLYFYLSQHPKIYMSPIKEPLFFSYWDNKPNFEYSFLVTEKEAYFSLFEKVKDGQVMGEASTSYLYLAEETIRNIYEFYGENARKVKILVILRNPVERAWSHYMMDTRDGLGHSDFNKCLDHDYIRELLDAGRNITLDYIGFGMYYHQIKLYLGAFDNVKVILNEDLENNGDATVQDVLTFLGVQNYPINTKTKYNASGNQRSGVWGWLARQVFQDTILKLTFNKLLPSRLKYIVRMKMGEKLLSKVHVEATLRKTVYEIYREDIDQLERLIGRDLTSWKSPVNPDAKQVSRSGIK